MGINLFVVGLDQVDARFVVGELEDERGEMREVLRTASLRLAAIGVGETGSIVNKTLNEALAVRARTCQRAVPIGVY